MILSADLDVQAVAEFMQRSVPAARLVSVAAGVTAMAPLLWGHYAAEDVCPLMLKADDLHILSGANGSSLDPVCVGDDFGVEVDAPR